MAEVISGRLSKTGEIIVDPECEWESRHYLDVAQHLIITQANLVNSIMYPERGTGRAEHIKGIIDNAIREVAGADSIVKEERESYVKALENTKNLIPSTRVSSRNIDAINAEIQTLLEQGVMFDMLEHFTKCNCQR